MSKYIMVLQDGETFTGLDGCYIAAIADDLDVEDIEDAIRDNDIHWMFRFEETDSRNGMIPKIIHNHGSKTQYVYTSER